MIADGFVAGGCVLLLANPAFATPPTVEGTADAEISPAAPPATAGDTGSSNFLNGLSRSDTLLGDMGGLRTLLSQYGVSLTVLETSEVLGDVSGGSRQGFDYDGLTQAILQVDTQRAWGWHGGTFDVSALQIHGTNLSAANLGTLQTASGIEADRSTRLWELWYDQKFFDEDRLDVKVGQQSLDQEFMVSQNALLFVNTMFGWPMVPSADLPGGGPAYPLSALGIRLRAHPTDSVTLLLGLFNGSPVTNSAGDPQKQNPSGTNFALNGGALAIAEVQYAYPSLGAMVYPGEAEPLARTYKLGIWYDTESFADQEFDNTGLSLASSASTGIAQTHKGDYGIYGVMDQMIWRSVEDADQNASFFTRVMGTPEEDRNLIDFSLNAGLTFHEPIPGRDNDTFGIGMGVAKVGDHASGLDADNGSFTGSYYPVRGSETFFEVTYQYQLTPWCQIQPDFQYVINPGAGALNPNAPGHRIANEFVLGLRMNISF
jgi:porin